MYNRALYTRTYSINMCTYEYTTYAPALEAAAPTVFMVWLRACYTAFGGRMALTRVGLEQSGIALYCSYT